MIVFEHYCRYSKITNIIIIMETQGTNISKRYTISNFKQEIKDLAQVQHEEKLFYRHPEKHPDFIDEYRDKLKEWYTKNSVHLTYRFTSQNYESCQAGISQTSCNIRRSFLSQMYKDYYALKHWKKLGLDDDNALAEYYFGDLSDVTGQKKLERLHDPNYYISNDPDTVNKVKDIEALYRKNAIGTTELINRRKELPHVDWFAWKRMDLLKKTDKAE